MTPWDISPYTWIGDFARLTQPLWQPLLQAWMDWRY
ncbi:hypothetical protein E143388_07879 [Rhodococcus opacus]|nr:hypothetical protein E143388_07879 [Rhodococcus opacus]